MPKTQKFLKIYKRHKKTLKTSLNWQGYYNIISCTFGTLSDKHIELIRRFLVKKTNKKNFLLARVTLTTSRTKKALKSRMGKGVGKLNNWISIIRPGTLLFEVQTNYHLEGYLYKTLTLLNKKLRFKLKLILKSNLVHAFYPYNYVYFKKKFKR